ARAARPFCRPTVIRRLERPAPPGRAVGLRHAPDRAGGRSRLAERAEARLELRHGPMAEEGQRDVQVPARDREAAANVRVLPLRQDVQRLVGEAETAEQTRTFTAFDASRKAHAAASRLCCKSRRTR